MNDIFPPFAPDGGPQVAQPTAAPDNPPSRRRKGRPPKASPAAGGQAAATAGQQEADRPRLKPKKMGRPRKAHVSAPAANAAADGSLLEKLVRTINQLPKAKQAKLVSALGRIFA